jgi:HD-GYP domain-containing protein (c-di-GMP phosphodiesterase class II)
VLKAALAVKDYVAQGHTERVKKLACMLGEAVGLTRSDLDTLRLLADIHDVGKLGVPEHILFKPSPLTREEWEEVRRHPEVGYRLALSSPELAPVAELIRQHHERWDGKGYPRGLRGEEIHVLSRILAIADAYDAMTSERPYRPALSREEALEELKRCAGTQFDPHLVEVFVKLLDEKREGRAERRASLRPDALPQGRSPQ